MKKCKFSLLAIVLTISLCWTSVSLGWDYNAEFSITNGNPNGVWTYGTINKTTGEFKAYRDPVSSSPNIRWESTDASGHGPDADGCTTKDMGSGSDHPEWQPGQSWYPSMTGFMSPLSDRSRGTGARFTAPTAAIYNINISFENRVIKGFTTEVYVNINGANVFSSSVTGFKSGAGNFAYYIAAVTLPAGGTIDFFDGSDQNASEDHGGGDHLVGVTAQITLGSSPVEPTQNLVMKLDAGVGAKDPNRPGVPLVDGDRVGIWEDQAASGLLDAAAKWGDPILKTATFPNGNHKVIRFDGNDGMMIYNLGEPNDQAKFLDPEDPNSVGPLDLNTYTIYVVGKLNQQLNTQQAFFANFNAEKGYVVGVSDSIPDYLKFWTNGGGEMRSGGPIDDTNRYYLIAGTVTNLLGKKAIVNDCVEAEGVGLSTYTKTTAVSVGALGNGSQFLKGDIAEIRVYDGFVEATHTGVVNDLVSKYGLNRECLGGPNPDIVALTYATTYRTSETGVGDYSYQTNTQYLDGPWDVALYEGPVSALDPNTSVALNNSSNMAIYIQLHLGEPKTISFMNALSGPVDPDGYYGMNLFFESSTNHQISIFGKLTDTKEEIEPFYENCSSSTAGYGGTAVPGACSFVAKIYGKDRKVTINDWKMYNETVWSLDMITTQTAGPSSGWYCGSCGSVHAAGGRIYTQL